MEFTLSDKQKRFEAFCNLLQDHKQKLFAACVAKSIQPQLSSENHVSATFEIISKRMAIDVSKDWTPTNDNFLSRVKKAELLDIGQEIFGEGWAKDQQKKPKGEIVALLHNAFDKPEQFTEEQTNKLTKYLPEGM